MAPTVRETEHEQAADETAVGASVPDQLGLPPGVYVTRELQQRLLRARTARALAPRLREATLASTYSAARVTGRPVRTISVGSANREIRERWVRVHASTTNAKAS